MRINRNNVLEKAASKGWSQNELARRMKIPRGTLSNALSGKRSAGRKLIAGLMRVFPEEAFEDLVVAENGHGVIKSQ